MAPHPLPSETENERVLLAGALQPHVREWEFEESMDELCQLSLSAGAEVLGEFTCKLRSPNPGYYLGKGKVDELASSVHDFDAQTVIFDDNLSPAQNRNLQNSVKRKVIDRTQLILDIFAQHAQTREGRLQIELAQLEYLLPRLRRMWTHLERQKGGIGVRGGPGEQQIELDRRKIKERIVRVRKDLEKVRQRREVQRRGRRRHGWALCSLVGYTNAGKSTLLNRLTGSDILAYDKLFATLDPTTRQLTLSNHQSVLLTDTVGFIRKLPHDLVEAFKATLEEVGESDLLIHVIDASHSQAASQIEAVNDVLTQLGAEDKPVLHVLNKTDRAEAEMHLGLLRGIVPEAVEVSARTGVGFDDLRDAIADKLKHLNRLAHLRIPLKEAKIISEIKAVGNIQAETYEDEHMVVDVRLPNRLFGRFVKFSTEPIDLEQERP